MSSIKYRPEVDGLRALAVIPVILFHLGFSWIAGGFVGVDVFFVISGYLISLIILREQQQGTFTFRSFWTRRARRILPVLSSVVLASMIAGFFTLFRYDWKALGEQGLSVFALIANFKMWKLAGDYWAPSAHETPLLHTWSLAVEEQFYLFYPLLLITILKFSKKHAFKIILGGTFLSFVLCVLVTRQRPAAAFYLLPTRAWELAAGCLLAMLTHNQPAGFSRMRLSPILSTLGAVTIIASYHFISRELDFPGYQALFPVIGTVMVIAFAAEGQFPGRILASPLICYLGKISYSLYLWHWPVIVYAHILELHSRAEVPVYGVVAITFGLSVASYHFIEKPTRSLRGWRLPVSILTLLSIAASIGLYAWPIHYDFSVVAPVVVNGRLYDVTPVQKPWIENGTDRLMGMIAPMRPQLQSNAYAEQGIVKNYGGPVPEIVVFGDSHASMWASTIDSVCKELGHSVSFFAAAGVPPEITLPLQKAAALSFTADEKFLFDSARLRILTEAKPKLVILARRYDQLQNGQSFDRFVQLITRSGANCLIIEQPPMMPFGDMNALIYTLEYGVQNRRISLPIGEAASWRHGRSIIDEASKKFSSVSILNIADLYLTDSSHVLLLDDDHVQYSDDDHLSEYGAMKARERMKIKIQGLLNH